MKPWVDLPEAALQYEKAIELDKAGQTPPSELAYVFSVLLSKQGSDQRLLSRCSTEAISQVHSTWANFGLGRFLRTEGRTRLPSAT